MRHDRRAGENDCRSVPRGRVGAGSGRGRAGRRLVRGAARSSAGGSPSDTESLHRPGPWPRRAARVARRPSRARAPRRGPAACPAGPRRARRRSGPRASQTNSRPPAPSRRSSASARQKGAGCCSGVPSLGASAPSAQRPAPAGRSRRRACPGGAGCGPPEEPPPPPPRARRGQRGPVATIPSSGVAVTAGAGAGATAPQAPASGAAGSPKLAALLINKIDSL